MNLRKTYVITVREDDFTYNFEQSRKLARRLLTNLMRQIGSIKFRMTIEVLMEKPPDKEMDAAFRSPLRHVPFTSSLRDILDSKFLKIIRSIDNFNANGMSGCRVKYIKSFKILVVRYAF